MDMANAVVVSREIVEFFKANKGIGHTKALTDGAASTRANFIVASEAEAKRKLRGVSGRKLICLAEIEAGQLRESFVQGWPMVIDNGAVTALLTALLDEIGKLTKAKAAKKAEKEPSGQ